MTEIHKNTLGYKILTNTGYKTFDGISFNGIQEVFKITFEDATTLTATETHEIYTDWFNTKPISKLKIGDSVLCQNDVYKEIKEIISNGKQKVYDVLEVDGVNRFYANGVLVHNCEFVGQTGTLVDSTTMKRLMAETNNLSYSFVIDGDIRFYKDLDRNMKYLVAIDPSMGVSGDFSAIQVFEFPSFIQVAEWQSDKLNQNEQVDKLKNLIDWMYADLKAKKCRSPEIYWSLENNSVGEGFICTLREKSINEGYEKPQDYIKYGIIITENGNKRIGFTTTKRTKTMACAQLKNFLENNKMKINSKEYVKELSNFTLKEVNYSANAAGQHDDLITASLTVMLMYIQNKNSFDLDLPKTDNARYEFLDNNLPFLYVGGK